MNQKTVLLVSSGGPVRAAVEAGYLVLDNNLTYSWRPFFPLFRVLLKGTGTCTIDSMDADGNISTAVETYTATAATNDVRFAYAGDDAVVIRASLTGSCSAELI